MVSRRSFLIVTALLASAASADSVPGAKRKLDAYFDGLQAQGQLSGSLAITERGALRYQRSIGFARVPAQTADRCEVEIRGKLVPARVVRPPFVRQGQVAIALD